MDEFGISVPMYIRDHFPVATVSMTIGFSGAFLVFLLVRYRVAILTVMIASVEAMIDRYKK